MALTAIEVSLRGWIIAKSDIIAQDGTYYLDMARVWRVDPDRAVRDFVVHPGYPAAVVAMHHILAGQGDADDLHAWERAGQYVALLGGVLAVWGVWAFGAMMFRDVWIGFFGALLFGLGRNFAAAGADVLSDSVMLCLAMWGLTAAMRASLLLRARRKIVLFWAAATGLLSAAAYWVRPEGGVVLLIALMVWLGIQVWRKLSWPLTLAAAVVAILTAALVAAPYGFTNKWQLKEFTALPSSGPLLAWLGAKELASTPAALEYLGKFFEAQQPVLASLTCLYLALWLLSRTQPGRRLGEMLPTITRTGGIMIVMTFICVTPPILLRYWSTGALSHRYLFLPAAMLAGAPVAAILGLARLAATRAKSERAARRIRWGAPAVAILALAAGLSGHALRPLHAGKAYAKNAGLWLADRMQPADALLTDQFYVGYYSRAEKSHVVEDSALQYNLAKNRPDVTPRQYVREQLDQPGGFRYVALKRQSGPSLLKDVADLLSERGYQQINEFPYVERGKARPKKGAIVVFERSSVSPPKKNSGE